MYLGLKTAYKEEKQRLKNEKDRKQEILEHSAQRLILSNNRRALPDFSDDEIEKET